MYLPCPQGCHKPEQSLPEVDALQGSKPLATVIIRCQAKEEEEDVTAVPAKARLISQLRNQATVQTKHEADMGVIEDMYKARTRFNKAKERARVLSRIILSRGKMAGWQKGWQNPCQSWQN